MFFLPSSSSRSRIIPSLRQWPDKCCSSRLPSRCCCGCSRNLVLVLISLILLAVLIAEGRIPCRIPRFMAVAMHSNNHQFTLERQRRAQRVNTIAQASCPATTSTTTASLPRIQLIMHATAEAREKYKTHLTLMECYARPRNIPLLVLDPFQYEECDQFQDVFFLRHCVTALFLKCADYTMFMDLDVLPQNELDNWEPYLSSYDVVFSQVTEGGEIAAGTFLARNTDYAREFLMDWASRERFQKCWNANGDQTPLHQLLMDRTRINARERAECDLYLERQKWPYEVQQFIRCAVWWIRVGSQWDEHIFITDMSDALTMTIRDYNAENIINSESGWASTVSLPGMGHKYERHDIPLPLSTHPFVHQIKPETLYHFIDMSHVHTCGDDSKNWKVPWLHASTMPLSMPPFPRGASSSVRRGGDVKY